MLDIMLGSAGWYIKSQVFIDLIKLFSFIYHYFECGFRLHQCGGFFKTTGETNFHQEK